MSVNQKFLEDLRSLISITETQALVYRFQKDSNNIQNFLRSKGNTTKSKFIDILIEKNQKITNEEQKIKRSIINFNKIGIHSNLNKYHNYNNKDSAIFFNKVDGLPYIHAQDFMDYYYTTKQSLKGEDITQSHIINRSLSPIEYANLQQLNCYFCKISSLRELGTGWKLKSLKIIKGNLVDLSGISGFANLNSLLVSYNKISDVSDLSYNQTLKEIDLQGNQIQDLSQMDYLQTITNLNYLNLDSNPVFIKNYHIIQLKLFGILDLQNCDYNYQTQEFLKFQQEDWSKYEGYQTVQLINQINQKIFKGNKQIFKYQYNLFNKKQLDYGIEDIIIHENQQMQAKQFESYLQEKIGQNKFENANIFKVKLKDRKFYFKERKNKISLVSKQNNFNNKENILDSKRKFSLRKKYTKKIENELEVMETIKRQTYVLQSRITQQINSKTIQK